MNTEKLDSLASQAGFNVERLRAPYPGGFPREDMLALESFAQLIVEEMCGMMEQAEDDAYHCFEPGERPTEYIEWLRDWQEIFTKHFGVEK